MNPRDPAQALMRLEKIVVEFPVRAGVLQRQVATLQAVSDVSLEIFPGETVGLVGESGCGKTTLGRAAMGLYPVNRGRILFEGQDLTQKGKINWQHFHANVQMIFQDPVESLNSRITVRRTLEEPLILHTKMTGAERLQRIENLLERVGLPTQAHTRFPHEFSGGQRQRIGIARAIALNPKLIICDEPVSALDVSIQAQIVNLLLDLQRDMQLSYLFIAHGLPVVRHVSDRIAVMYLGKIVEYGKAEEIYHQPQHPYTQALLHAVPQVLAEKQAAPPPLKGEIPSPLKPPSGCRFHPRCPLATDLCRTQEPELKKRGSLERTVACHLV